MLFHAKAMPGRGIDIEQVTVSFDEQVDPEKLREAWSLVFSKVPELRTGFNWQAGSDPHRFIPDSLDVPFQVWDWRTQSREDQIDNFLDYVERDRREDFDLAKPPLHRLLLIQLQERHWVLLWTFHHLLLDGRSFPLVLKRVFAHYDREETPSTATSFDTYLDALRERNATNAIAAREYFIREFESLDPAPDIVVDPERSSGDYYGAVESFLSDIDSARIDELASSAGLSTNNLLQAAWSILLHRYTGRNEVVFGSTRACRHLLPEAADMMGLLINTLPMRTTVNRADTVASLCRQIAERQVALREFETTPIQDIQSWCGVQSGQPLFNSLLMFDTQTLDERMRDPNALERRYSYRGQTNFPLALIAYGGERLQLRIEHDRSQIGDAAAARMVKQLSTILSSFCEGLEQKVRDVAYLSDSDQDLLASWNETTVCYPAEETLVSLFRKQAARTPDAIALRFQEKTLTYAELNDWSDRLAEELQRRGVGSGDVVALLAYRSIELYAAVYGILKSGAAYLPLDPEYPAARTEFVIKDAGVSIIVCAGGATAPPEINQGITRLNVDSETLEPAGLALRPPDGGDAAYLIYTSGSTGQPKGVTNEHGGIVNRLLWMQEAFKLDKNDVVMHKTPITFDVSVWELFWPLQVGAQVAIASPEAHRDPKWLATEIDQFRVTTLHFVPSMLQLFIESSATTDCSSICRIICSGEALSRNLQDRTLAKLEVELHNLYGPTEAAIDVTWWPCDPESDLPFVPIGRPIANTSIHILDAESQPVPPGATGEIYIGGIQVARGYLNRPELTAERFLTMPGAESVRCYRTGDLGRHLPDGAIAFSGRVDHQIKLRGLRIELGEIESVLQTHPGVHNSAVIDHVQPSGETVLIAYYEGPAQLGDDDLRNHLSAQLADYMIPWKFIHLAALPLSPSGKVSRKQLPTPRLESDQKIEMASSDTERMIAAEWSDLLGEPRIDRNQAFFDAGGTSLLTVKLALRLSERVGRELRVAELLANPTVALQAQLVSGGSTNDLSDVVDQAKARRRAASQRRKIMNARREARS